MNVIKYKIYAYDEFADETIYAINPRDRVAVAVIIIVLY
jgi:hypothetical protein